MALLVFHDFLPIIGEYSFDMRMVVIPVEFLYFLSFQVLQAAIPRAINKISQTMFSNLA